MEEIHAAFPNWEDLTEKQKNTAMEIILEKEKNKTKLVEYQLEQLREKNKTKEEDVDGWNGKLRF